MHKKVIVLSLLALHSVSIFAMDDRIELKPIYLDETEVNWNSCFLRTDNIKITIPDVYVGGQAHTRESDDGKKESGELFYLDEKDPIKQVSFRELITEQHKKDMAYILAVLLVKNKHDKYVRYYQDANSLLSRIFKFNTAMVRTKNRHIILGRKIEKSIYFYSLFPGDKDFIYVTSELELRKQLIDCRRGSLFSISGSFFAINVNFLRYKKNRTFTLAAKFCKKQKKIDMAKKYLFKAIELEDEYAMFEYAKECLAEKKYDEAKKYAIESESFVLLAQIYLAQKKYKLMKETFERILSSVFLSEDKKGLTKIALQLLDKKISK